MDLRRWTPLTALVPARYVDYDREWRDFDLRGWSSDEYEWTEDSWNGFRDFARRPADTVAEGRGDCEDYALVAASWAVGNDRPGVGIAFCWELPYPWPTHVVAFDDERVYSSGNVVEASVSEWVETSRYDFAVRRRI
jgi:hypothetical protein